ncbi:TonB-dependent receptor plug domain-containing protein [Bacteroides salyersiae]|uniref:TonB-dependent receptor plug domain-containing protein n=1 Tax=Bacteroides salyersiae TaxID=291644 RepID=UPI001C8C2842|nr:TonB-dependent receptor plug domain-containing protein [Bacteroides salyersiae]
MKRHLYLLFIAFGFACGDAVAQDLKEKVSDYFQLHTVYPQEKLYLHLDKPYYAAGERIYWKGYLVDAVSHAPNTKSNFVYVELIDRDDKVISKYKVRREQGSFHGSILLPADIPAGEYYMRAFTQWMLNGGEEYFYHRRLRIGNALDRSIQSAIRYEDSPKEGYCTVVIRFTDETGKPLPDVQIQSWLTIQRRKAERYSRRTNVQGEISFDIPLVEKQDRERAVEITFKDDLYTYDKTFYVPLLGDRKKEFALSFFPEGGDLLAGCRQRVAFKAQRKDGRSCEVHGILLSETGDTITRIRTEHDGMGVFTFLPVAGQKYRAKVSLDSIAYKDFALPEVKTEGRQLGITHRKGVIQYQVLQASQQQWTDTLYLIGHTRGHLTLFLPLTAGRATGRFRETDLSEGITELLLADHNGTVLSRRLVFVAPEELVNLEMSAFPELPERRKLVELPLRFTDMQGAPVEGIFSVSLTDKSLVTPDTLAGNLRSDLLLTSDLKGYVENPGGYFLKRDARTEYNTDLLMLTHGWTRFRHDNLAELPTIRIDYFMEGGQAITGKATTMFGAKAKDCPVALMAPSQGISATAYTDAEGNFVFDGIEFRDTVTFVAQARSKAGLSTVYLRVDSLPYLPPRNPFPVTVEEDHKFQEYDNSVRNAYLSEGGMQVVRLNEVTITASKRDAGAFSSIYGGLADYRATGEELRRFGGSTGYDILMRVPGVRVSGDLITLSGQSSAPLFLIDEMRFEGDDAVESLRGLDANDIKSIEIVKGVSAGFLGPEAAAGAILIMLNTGADVKAKASPGLAVFTTQGYNKAVEFYHPVYETPEQKSSQKSDVRSTVYWNPDLKTDADGRTVIRFYTPDNLIKPHLILEGVTAGGYLMRFER